jgi:hypothetical protein
LDFHEAPDNKGVRGPLGNHGYSWIVEVTMFEKAMDDGIRGVCRVHSAIAPRATFELGTEDATCQALAILCR